MEKITYSEVEETIYKEVFENGLPVTLIPRTGLSKVFGFFVTIFGAQDLSFLPLGEDEIDNAPSSPLLGA